MAKGSKTKYSQEDKDNAIAAFLANGCNYWKTARELNIPYATIRNWVASSPAIAAVVQKHKNTFVKTSWAVLGEALKTLKKKMKDPATTVDEMVKVINCLTEKQGKISAQSAAANTPDANPKPAKSSAATKKILGGNQSDSDESQSRTIQLSGTDG